jgi:hypothetical protein
MGQTLTALALEVEVAMGEPASRSWLSWRFNHLTARAKERIADARCNAAPAFVQSVLDCHRDPAPSAEIPMASDDARLTRAQGPAAGEGENGAAPRDLGPART